MSTAAATIVAKPYLSHARLLARSFGEHHPEIPFFGLLADEVDGRFDPAAEPFELVELDALDLDDGAGLRFRYEQQALSYALTPHFVGHLLDRGFDRVVFIKQESLVLDRLDPLLAALEDSSVVLTPHLLAPATRGARADDPPVGRLQRRDRGRRRNARRAGLPALVGRPRALSLRPRRRRRTALRAALARPRARPLRGRARPARPDGQRRPLEPRRAARAHPRRPRARRRRAVPAVSLQRLQPGAPDPGHRVRPRPRDGRRRRRRRRVRAHRGRARAAGWAESAQWPYAWDRFSDGVPIPPIARAIHRSLGAEAARFGDPFERDAPGGFAAWLGEPVDGTPITRLWQAVIDQRADIRAAFPDPFGADRDGFLRWTAESGAREHLVSPLLWSGAGR